jgi:nucleotidyltransferase substrate binding protein (TIGR01987 family)
MIDYSKFEKALKHLELQNENYKQKKDSPDLAEIDKEAIAESVIQRFETCYDCLWKVLKRYLEEELGIPEVPNSPKGILRLADENKLFTSSLKIWFGYAQARIDTTHDYSEEKAYDALVIMDDFISDAIDLYIVMSQQEWE